MGRIFAMQELFLKLPRHELERDLTGRVMKRVRAHEATRALERLIFMTLPLGVVAFGLVGYRWYTFLESRDYSSVAGKILAHLGHLSNVFTLGYWLETVTLVRQSVPMVETMLLMVNVVIVAIFAWKFFSLKLLERRSERALATHS